MLVLVLGCGTGCQDSGGPPTREARIEAAIETTKNAKPRIRSTSVKWVDSPERFIHLTWVNVSSITRCGPYLFRAFAVYPWSCDSLRMVEINGNRSWAPIDRYALPTNDPEEPHLVCRWNGYVYCLNTDTYLNEGITRGLSFLVEFEPEFTLLKDKK